MRPLRILRRVLAGLGMLVMLGVAVIAGLLWLSAPSDRQTVAIDGLSALVEITIDQDDVPRIHAASSLDGATALGFVHARDRMFQMELMRRAASGRLSELAGAVTLPVDRQMRLFGLRQRALADLETLPAPTRDILTAYAKGVNAWIAARGRFAAPEFLAFGAPEPWEPVDSLLWGKTMALWLSSNWRTELSRLALAGTLSPEQIGELWPPDRQQGRPDARTGGVDWRFAAAATDTLKALPACPAPFSLPATASNAWAVDGRQTASGKPLLAGDPHLQFGLPGIWYLARIETPHGVLAGATAPGVPFLVLGHNGHVAWSFTTTGADTQDVFIETPSADGGYETPDGPRPFTVREERIHVHGQPDQVLRVRESRHGPIVSDLDGHPGGPILAVAMANLQPNDTAAQGLLALNEAGTVEEAGEAAALISAPVQNLIVADSRHIGLFVTGRVPIRRAGNGSAPTQGADGAHDWIGWAGGTELPHVVAPESGMLLNANERVAPPDFPAFLGRDWFGSWRADRIRQLLSGSDRHTPAGFAKMQTDIQSGFARQLLPRLLEVQPPEGVAARAAALLKDWDGAMAVDLPQPLIFNAWVSQFYGAVLARAGVTQPGVAPMMEFVSFVLSPQGAHWCGGDCTTLLRAALTTSVADLAARFGADPAAWRWGEPHQVVFAHPFLRSIPLIGQFATARIETPGDDATLDRATPANGSFEDVHGASYRGVYDLADLDGSLFMVAPGQSGYPFGGGARNFLTRWRDGDIISLGPSPATVTGTIRLTP